MNSDQMKGKFKQFSGEIKRKWGQITDDDLRQAQGSMEKLVGKIQERSGDQREAIENQVKQISESEKEEEDYIPEISIPAEPIIFETANLESGNESGNRSEMRQSAILERIRQSGNCRLADIQAILPGASERTLRYDLESLIQKNLIERMGAGGRSVYYRAK